jgi:hypothetical protein
LLLGSDEIVVEERAEKVERRSRLGIGVPALQHDVVEHRGGLDMAARRWWHAVALLDALQHRPVVHVCTHNETTTKQKSNIKLTKYEIIYIHINIHS